MKKNFASHLRQLRGDLSQADFASKLGTKQTTYSSWERGLKEPPLDTVMMISRLFGVTTDWLLGLSDNPHPHKGASNASVGGNGIAINGHTTNSTITNGAVHDETISERVTKLEEEVERLNKVIGKN